MQQVWSWIQQNVLNNELLLSILIGGSIMIFLVTLVFMPLFAARIPADYFKDETKHKPIVLRNPLLHLIYKLLKNLLGLILFLLGVLMLFTPGQGVLCILMASVLLDYPGKLRFQRYLINKKPVLKGINWLRKKGGSEPLQLD